MKSSRFGKTLVVVLLAGIIGAAAYFFLLRSTPPQQTGTPEPKKPNKEFRIAVLAPAEGPFAAAGNSIMRGAQVAAQHLELAGAIHDHRITIVPIDTAGSIDALAQQLPEQLKEERINAILGTADRDVAVVAAEAAEELQLPFIALINGPLLTCRADNKKEVSPFVWQLGLTEVMTVEPFLVNLVDSFGTAGEPFVVSYFGTSDYRSRSEADYLIDTADSLGLKVGAEEYPDPRVRDHYETLRGMLRIPAQVMFISVTASRLKDVMQQAQKMSVRRDMLIAGLRSFTEEALTELGELAEGVYTDIGYHPELENKMNKLFLTTWRQSFPDAVPTSLAARAYSAVRIYAAAFAVAGSTEHQALQQAMSKLDVDMPQGRLLADPDNHTFNHPLYIGYVEEGKLKLGQYLGDVAHPGLKRCEPLGAPPPTPTPTPERRFGVYDDV